jgi:hypothetical protein
MDNEQEKKHGLANATPETRRRISSMGGFASQESGKAHKFTREENQRGGKLGGVRSGEVRRMKRILREEAERKKQCGM